MSTENNVFTKKHEEAMAQDKRAILEEMNLPPALISFLRKNSTTIKALLLLAVVGVVGWESYAGYTQRLQEKSSAMLYSAISSATNEQKVETLNNLVEEYSKTKSGLWGKIELAHLAFKEKKYEEAVSKYNEVLNGLSKSSSLYPLVQYSVAQAYDSLNDDINSKKAYQELLDYSGFAAEGYLGLGRLAEKSGDNVKALEMYESYISLPNIQESQEKDLVQHKINKLKES